MNKKNIKKLYSGIPGGPIVYTIKSFAADQNSEFSACHKMEMLAVLTVALLFRFYSCSDQYYGVGSGNSKARTQPKRIRLRKRVLIFKYKKLYYVLFTPIRYQI